jgi:hypothetical protein
VQVEHSSNTLLTGGTVGVLPSRPSSASSRAAAGAVAEAVTEARTTAPSTLRLAPLFLLARLTSSDSHEGAKGFHSLLAGGTVDALTFCSSIAPLPLRFAPRVLHPEVAEVLEVGES